MEEVLYDQSGILIAGVLLSGEHARPGRGDCPGEGKLVAA